MFRQRVGFVTAVTAAFLVGMGGLAMSADTDDTTVYTACVAENGGAMRLIDPTKGSDAKRNTCTGKERQITWNAEGPAGPAGQSGISALTGQRCPAGEMLVGFTADGGLDCSLSGDVGGGDPDDDTDADNDGVPDAEDVCPFVPRTIRDGVAYDCPATLTSLLTGVTPEGTTVWIANLRVAAVNDAIVTLTDAGTATYEGEDTSVIDLDFTGFGIPEIGSYVTVYGVAVPKGERYSLQLGYVDLVGES
jgi:hypothetical protein